MGNVFEEGTPLFGSKWHTKSISIQKLRITYNARQSVLNRYFEAATVTARQLMPVNVSQWADDAGPDRMHNCLQMSEAAVNTASPVEQPLSASHSASRPVPAASKIEPHTPPPRLRPVLEALTIASTWSVVISHCSRITLTGSTASSMLAAEFFCESY